MTSIVTVRVEAIPESASTLRVSVTCSPPDPRPGSAARMGPRRGDTTPSKCDTGGLRLVDSERTVAA
jgi:hypothetical protein